MFDSIDTINKKIKEQKITKEELVKESVKKSKEINSKYNAFVTIIDKPKMNKKAKGDLAGIPYSAKDLFSTKGVLTTGSSNALKDYVPFFDATVIERLNASGAVLTSKSVCDEFGLGGTGMTGHTGVVRNPYDDKRQAGGSSAGSAVAVATGCVPFALGTDTGDSIRKPASFCGIVGYKPTYGLISRYGVLPFASSLDHVGVFTQNVKDAAIVVDAIKGPDGKDMTALPKCADLTPQLNGKVEGKRLFYIKEICDIRSYDNPSEELKKTIEEFNKIVALCKEMGMQVIAESINEKLLKAIEPTYEVISCAEATSNLSMYTGIIYGPRGVGANINEMVKDYRTHSFSPLIKRRLVIGSYVLQKENQEKYYLNACKVRRMIIDKFNELFLEYDACLTLASGKGAPLLDEKANVLDSEAVLENHLAIGNFGGFPSITIPFTFVDKLPVGINLTGKVKDDANVLNIAYALENKIEFKGGINE